MTMLILFSVCLEYNRGWVLDDRHKSGQQKCGTLEEKLLCRCIAEFNANKLFYCAYLIKEMKHNIPRPERPSL